MLLCSNCGKETLYEKYPKSLVLLTTSPNARFLYLYDKLNIATAINPTPLSISQHFLSILLIYDNNTHKKNRTYMISWYMQRTSLILRGSLRKVRRGIGTPLRRRYRSVFRASSHQSAAAVTLNGTSDCRGWAHQRTPSTSKKNFW